MAYDGFYAELSTRASVNEILNQAIIVRDEVEADLEEYREIKVSVDASVEAVETAADLAEGYAAEAQTSANNSEASASSSEAYYLLVQDFIPEGGTDGQVLTKVGTEEYATEWRDSSGGGGGITDSGWVMLDRDVGNEELYFRMRKIGNQVCWECGTYLGIPIEDGMQAEFIVPPLFSPDSYMYINSVHSVDPDSTFEVTIYNPVEEEPEVMARALYRGNTASNSAYGSGVTNGFFFLDSSAVEPIDPSQCIPIIPDVSSGWSILDNPRICTIPDGSPGGGGEWYAEGSLRLNGTSFSTHIQHIEGLTYPWNLSFDAEWVPDIGTPIPNVYPTLIHNTDNLSWFAFGITITPPGNLVFHRERPYFIQIPRTVNQSYWVVGSDQHPDVSYLSSDTDISLSVAYTVAEGKIIEEDDPEAQLVARVDSNYEPYENISMNFIITPLGGSASVVPGVINEEGEIRFVNPVPVSMIPGSTVRGAVVYGRFAPL